MKKFITLSILLFFGYSVSSQVLEPDTNTVLNNNFKLSDKEVKDGQTYEAYDIEFIPNTNELNLKQPNQLDSVIEFIKKHKLNYIFIVVRQEKKLAGKIEENLGWEQAKSIRKYMRRKGVKDLTTIHIKAMCTARNYEDIKNKVKKTDDTRTINVLQKKSVSFYIMKT